MSFCEQHKCPHAVCDAVHVYHRSNNDFQRGYQRGQLDMLESIRASLRDYPNAGGDIEVMREVERIVKEAVRVAIEKERS